MNNFSGLVKMHASEVIQGCDVVLEGIYREREKNQEKLIQEKMKGWKIPFTNKWIHQLTYDKAKKALINDNSFLNDWRMTEIAFCRLEDDIIDLKASAEGVIKTTEPWVYVTAHNVNAFKNWKE